MRTLETLQRDMDQNAVNQWVASCAAAIESGNASHARTFALAAIRAAYRLLESEQAVRAAQAQIETLARIARLNPVGMLTVKGVR